ncbi:hypothetical protein CRYUN_Cryun01aG0241700 [Craigia yunnanensis]
MATRIATVFASLKGFITDHETALEELFSEDAEKSRKFEVCLNTMATQIATVFASLKVPNKSGGPLEKKEVLLDDHDPVWLELLHAHRHNRFWLELRQAHMADASERLHDMMTKFKSRIKAAQSLRLVHCRDGSELSTRDLQKIVQALPQYNEIVEKLSLHVEIAGTINKLIREMGLRELGQLEQDLVFGDAGAKDVINFLRTKQLARLSPEDMKVVSNMQLLGVSSQNKKATTGFSFKFDGQKELIDNLSKSELPKNDYSCMNEPSPTVQDKSQSGSTQTRPTPATPTEKKACSFNEIKTNNNVGTTRLF